MEALYINDEYTGNVDALFLAIEYNQQPRDMNVALNYRVSSITPSLALYITSDSFPMGCTLIGLGPR